MAPGLATLSDEETAQVAAWFASLPAGEPSGAAPTPEQAALAQQLMQVGDWAGRDLPACVSCHGPGARGVGGSFPALAGQHAPYLETQLRAWKSGARTGDPGELMATVAKKLSDEEIVAVSAWLAAQPREVR